MAKPFRIPAGTLVSPVPFHCKKLNHNNNLEWIKLIAKWNVNRNFNGKIVFNVKVLNIK